jgi:transmembrane sensor
VQSVWAAKAGFFKANLFHLMHSIDQVILDSLLGTASDSQLRELDHWLQASPQNDLIYQQILNHWYQERKMDEAQLERIWQQVTRQTTEAPVVPVRSLWRHLSSIAAAVLVLIAIGGIGYYHWSQKPTVFVTGNGQKLELELPDQSHISLNANSRLWYHRDNPRRVWLEGEAFFKVAKKPVTGAIFQVHTADLVVNVLGTQFNVNSRQQETHVYLQEGSVKLDFVAKPRHELVLEPGELLSYSALQDTFAKKRPLSANLISWKNGSVIMETERLSRVLDRINAIYGIKITPDDAALLDRTVTLAFPVENLDITLQTLNSVLDRHVVRKSETEYLIQ